MSPTTLFTQGDGTARHCRRCGGPAVGEGCTRGGAGWVGGLGCYTGTHPVPSQMTIFSHILSLRQYPRPNEGNSEVFNEVSLDRV